MHSKTFRSRKRCLVQGQAAVYHVVSRTAYNRYSLTQTPHRVFLSILHKQAAFSGFEVLAYCLMSNHFHLLVRVPSQSSAIDDELLLKRYRCLYGGKHVPFSSPEPEVLEALLKENGPDGQAWRERILRRMHDLRPFMRELKQRFGIWFNRHHGNRGTLWSERYKHVLIEDCPAALSATAAYIDLNPVRAQLVSDPGEYRYSSYGAAMGGDQQARRGYEKLYRDGRGWGQLLGDYQRVLYGMGAESKGELGKDAGRIAPERVRQVLSQGGRVPLSEALRLRIRYFTAGAILGSRVYVESMAQELYRHRVKPQGPRNRRPVAHRWRGVTTPSTLYSFRNLQTNVIS